MPNERVTENLTLQEMQISLSSKNDSYFVHEQGDIASIAKIDDLLKEAGGKPKDCELTDFGKGGGGKSHPEFLITFPDKRDIIIVIECKKSCKNHSTEDYNHPKDYAVDGVLYYAKFLKKEYNVIAIAVSGTSKSNWRVSTFDWRKGQSMPQEIAKGRDVLYSPENYLRLISGENVKRAISMREIRELALVMHENLRVLKVSEKNQPVFIAGILIALKDPTFLKEYNNSISFQSLYSRMKEAINKVLTGSDIQREKIDDIRQNFESIGRNGKLATIPLAENYSLLWFISELDKKIKPMMDYADITVDALGVFYHEFVKYSGGDGSGLGIVLTPQHLTEFMCDIAQINKNQKVVDICCGSGTFLITAMSKMFKEANDTEMNTIKKEQLFGVEFDDGIYTLAIANMIVRGDGKSNVFFGDCFNEEIRNRLKGKHLNIGLINPPYSQKDHSELEFVLNLLDILEVGGTGVVVVPMSCAIGTKFKEERRRLFERHTLEAVFSMPDDIFSSNQANTNVCVMVWTAHRPHNPEKQTFFGYYKDDGFVKAKKLGRIDKYGKWNDIRKEWVNLFLNKTEKKGFTCKKSVTWQDEWLCEAYMETDYSTLTDHDFEQSLRNFIAFQIKAGDR